MKITANSSTIDFRSTKVIIKDWMYNLKIIPYEEVTKIEYCYRSGFEGGYIDFHNEYNKYDRFEFGQKQNQDIKKIINILSNKFPEIDIVKTDAEDMPFYSRNIFILIITLFFPLIGIILIWCTGKRTVKRKLIFTLAVIIIDAFRAYVVFTIYMNRMNEAMNMINDSMQYFY